MDDLFMSVLGFEKRLLEDLVSARTNTTNNGLKNTGNPIKIVDYPWRRL
jgi:hypothetical protein